MKTTMKVFLVDFFRRSRGCPQDPAWVTCIRRPALAYFDVGTGTMIFQMLIAAVLGIGIFWRTLWWRVKRLFGGATEKAPQEPPADD
jgi:hypothetical protein